MAKESIIDRGRQIEEAMGASDVPALLPTGPQQITIDDRPTGAMKVAVLRDIPKVYTALKAVAARSGSEFYYRWPVKDKEGKTDWIEGPSVKCTNAVARQYGNCTVRVRAFDQGQHWMIMAQFIDLETGFALERPFQQRKNQNIGGKMDKDRALDIVFQIGVSKACRNVVANALSEFVDYAFDQAKANIVETVGKSMDQYRQKVNARLQELKIPVDRIERLMGKPFEKWLAPDLAQVIAEIQAIQDGMADPDEMWPPQESGQARPQETAQQVEDRREPDPQPTQAKAEPAKEEPKAEPAKEAAKAEPAKAAAPADGGTEAYVTNAMREIAHPKITRPVLDKHDENVSTILGREADKTLAEAQNVRWNRAYMLRMNEIRAGQMENSGVLEMLPKEEAAQPDRGQDLQDWFKDMLKELDAVKTREDLDRLEDSVADELAGNESMLADWKSACNTKFRSMSRGR